MTGNISVNYTLWKRGPVLNTSCRVSPAFTSSQSRGGGYFTAFNFSVSRYFEKIKLGGSIAVSDPFHGHKFLSEESFSDSFRMTARRERMGRVARINIYWRFGKFKNIPGEVSSEIHDM